MNRHTDTVLAAARKIQQFRTIVSLVKDAPQRPSISQRLRTLARKVGPLLRAVGQLRFALRPLGPKAWWMVIDSSRMAPGPDETAAQFLDRIGRTNRAASLRDVLNISDDVQIIDVARSFGVSNGAMGTLPFVFALAGPGGTVTLLRDIWTEKQALGSTQAAVIYAALRLVQRRADQCSTGFLMFTTVTWLAEALRVGLAQARADIDIVEVLHGAGTKNTAPYFEWVHEIALGTPRYVNLIADLPRYAPLKHHMVCDTQGEIACNARFWQDRCDKTFPVAKTDTPPVIFVGGASSDPDYTDSSYFQKELSMMRALHAHGLGPIHYSLHPVHRGDIQAKLVAAVTATGAQIGKGTTLGLIVGAKAVVGGLSTSLIEAGLLGIPSFAYEDFTALFVSEIGDFVHSDTDQDALARAVAAALSANQNTSPHAQMDHVAELAYQRFGLQLTFKDIAS